MIDILTPDDFNIHGDRVKLEVWLRKYEMDEILSNQRLAKLVLEEIRLSKIPMDSHEDNQIQRAWLKKLQSLVDKSKEIPNE